MINKAWATLCSGLLASVLPACDMVHLQELKPGISTATEVRDRMGPPAMEWMEGDGTLVWEYPRTPEGVVNYMIIIGSDKVLREIRQVLTEENFARVKPGMSRGDVRRLLGKPAHEIDFPLKNEHVWDWKTKVDPGMEWFFNVHFDADGRVVRTSTNFVPKG